MTYEWAIPLGSLIATVGAIWFAAVKLRRVRNGPTMDEIRLFVEKRLGDYYTQMQGRIDRIEDQLRDHHNWHLGQK